MPSLCKPGFWPCFGWIDYTAVLAAGTMLGIGFFLGREHAQAEDRWQDEWGKGTVWNAFDLRKWDAGSVMDLVFPVVVCGAIFWVLILFRSHPSGDQNKTEKTTAGGHSSRL